MSHRSLSLELPLQTLHCSVLHCSLVWFSTRLSLLNARSEFSRAVERLECIGSQDALILLSSSFIAPRVQQLQCTVVLLYGSPGTTCEFDELLKSVVSLIFNSYLFSLPLKDGGLGIRRCLRLQFLSFWPLL